VPLVGLVGGGGTFVVGGPGSTPGNGLPVYDQAADLAAASPAHRSTSCFVALFKPGETLASNCPLSAVILGDPRAGGRIGASCAEGVSWIDLPPAGSSVERTTWPANTWQVRRVPNPNRASCALGNAPRPIHP
jgi:hypothetical protein